MKNVSGIAVIALVSGLTVLATGCEREPDERGAIENNEGVVDAQNDARDANNTLEQSADRAGQAVKDAASTTSIKTKYLADDTLKGLDISVDTEQGVVTLTGSVQSDAAKNLAEQIAKDADGVTSVNNQLTVN